MLPIAPILLIVFWALRKGGVVQPSKGTLSIPIRFADLPFVVALLSIFTATVLVITAETVQSWAFLVGATLLPLPFAFPSLAAGWIRRWQSVNLAFWTLRLFAVSALRGDPPGGATALLLLSPRPISEPDLARMAKRLRGTRKAWPMTVLAWALLAERRGDKAHARALFGLLAVLPKLPRAARARRAARLWCMAEAAAEGDWDALERWGGCGALRGGADPRAALRLTAEVRRRRAGGPPGSTWLHALRSGVSRAALRRLDTVSAWPPPGAPTDLLPLPEGQGAQGPLAVALHWMAELRAQPRAHPAHLRQVGEAWDAVEADADLLDHLRQRADTLQLATAPEALRDRLIEPALVELSARIGAERTALDGARAEGTLALALARARAPREAEVTDLLADLAPGDATVEDDWLRLARLREAVDWLYQTGSPAQRHSVYREVLFVTLSHAAQAFNQAHQTPFAFVTMTWLWGLAHDQQDAEHLKLLEDNLKVPLGE